jgi:glucose/arabinose dehydrogenase
VRFLRFTSGGDLLASLPRSGQVLRLEPDRDGDGRFDERHEVVAGLNRPHGLDVHDGWLYVAETDASAGSLRPLDGRARGPLRPVVTSPRGATTT